MKWEVLGVQIRTYEMGQHFMQICITGVTYGMHRDDVGYTGGG